MTEDERSQFEIEGSIDHIRRELSRLYSRRDNSQDRVKIAAARGALNSLQDAVTDLRRT